VLWVADVQMLPAWSTSGLDSTFDWQIRAKLAFEALNA
jgi:hypothetical protein